MRRLIFLIIMLFPMWAWSANYYVDCNSAAGGDGTTTATSGEHGAWDAIADVNGATFEADDFIYFAKGCTWREKLTVPSSGTSGHPITFGAYGEGKNPKLIGSEVFSTSGFTLTTGQTYTYEAAMATTPGWVWEDEVPLLNRTSITTVEATKGTWWWDSAAQKTYIHASDDSNVTTNGKVYEKSAQTENINTNTKDYITIDGIDCVRTGGDNSSMGGILVTGDYTIVQNLTTEGHRRHCASFYNGAANGLFKNMVIKDSYVTGSLAIYGDGTDGNTVENCDLSAPTFKVSNQAHAAVIHGTASDNIIDGCDLHDGEYGIQVYDDGTDNNIIRNSHFYGASTVGANIRLNADNTQLYYNLFEATIAANQPGIGLYTAAINTKIYNNTFVGGTGEVFLISLSASNTGTKIKNNIISSKRGISVSADSVTDTEVDYNIYNLTSAGTQFQWNGSNYATFALWKTGSSQDAHSASASPVFRST